MNLSVFLKIICVPASFMLGFGLVNLSESLMAKQIPAEQFAGDLDFVPVSTP